MHTNSTFQEISHRQDLRKMTICSLQPSQRTLDEYMDLTFLRTRIEVKSRQARANFVASSEVK